MVQSLLALKDLLGPGLLLPSSLHPLFPNSRCEFSLSPGPLPPRGPRTPGVPLHHQLYAGRAHHPHTHLHHLLYDSCTAPGQERFTSMTRLYYRDASACVIMFDVTNATTFSNSQRWKQDLDSKLTLPNGELVPCLLLANKCDLSPWAVSRDQIDRFSKENGFTGWTETSVKENKNINEAMRVLIEKMMRNSREDIMSLSTQGDYINLQTKSSSWSCC
uniref:Solute carrier family 41 member 1 n=2 Tax=Macaca TaxID=9539 RepID=A0A1D5QVN4_MACMU